ncbi:MAG: tetratricopeptide repeat protein [Bdellovibrionia bacterium]
MSPSRVTPKFKSFAAALFLAVALVSCQWIQSFTRPADKGLRDYESVAKTKPGTKEALVAAREGARVAFLDVKDYRKALFFYKYLVLYSDDEQERRDSQKHIAEIYFERLTDYDQSVVEYNRLLALPHGKKENADYRMSIAKAYFYLNRFSQADAELDLVIRNDPVGPVLFDANLLRANISLSTRKIDSAIEIFKALMEKFPQQAKDEHVGLSLAVCYEEKNDFKAARQVLNGIRDLYPRPDFIDLKIQRLQERESQQPGAAGLRK